MILRILNIIKNISNNHAQGSNYIRIFLMASLIMLSVSSALIGNMNLFPNAMASGKNVETSENSQEYEIYYSDNNGKYRANYDYDYQQQQQQQQQPGYSNNYGYDNNKKISYNNSYDNDNSKYSKYPTKDKKYVCQTGQFEGFFVESVEFCKLKIAQGGAGPQGPAGLVEINSTNL